MTDHPKLSRSPLVETLFELQFDRVADYALFAGSIYSSLKSEFTERELLAPPDLPEFSNGLKILRHRFKRKDGSALFQIGNGIISINQFKYDRFTSFIALVKKILNELIKVETHLIVNRMGLRYINRIQLDNQNISDLLSINISLPESINNKLEAIKLNFMVNKNSEGKLLINISNPIKKGKPLKEIAVDLDNYIDLSKSMDINEIESWINIAHDNIYDVFKSCINSIYWESLK